MDGVLLQQAQWPRHRRLPDGPRQTVRGPDGDAGGGRRLGSERFLARQREAHRRQLHLGERVAALPGRHQDRREEAADAEEGVVLQRELRSRRQVDLLHHRRGLGVPSPGADEPGDRRVADAQQRAVGRRGLRSLARRRPHGLRHERERHQRPPHHQDRRRFGCPAAEDPRRRDRRDALAPDGKLFGFSLSSARSPSDVYSVNLDTQKLERWTESETGGLNPARNSEPQLITLKSFDGTQISAFLYRPSAERFPGKRPVLINIHGGPEGQSQPVFLGRNNYIINEMGIALVYPNVRGSTGYGKSYLAMDNGLKREDSVKDIGALIDWIKSDPMLDGARIGVVGGSYGGYMTLATMTHYNDAMRAAIDVVGISNFMTFFQNTSDYRKDLRRVEYGDEREPQMKEFFERISPIASASKITKPLFVVAGFNDPRVPWTEGEQMVKTVRANGAPVWWLMAKDEGHGFAKRRNQDFQFLATMLFLQKYLVE
ncbi:MAG: prolyl oligopeptidase family serine peptidase [Acidobacteriota bacterium]